MNPLVRTWQRAALLVVLASIHGSASASTFKFWQWQSQIMEFAPYSDFQISDGFGGDAQYRAAAVFKDPFSDIDLSQASFKDYDIMSTMKEAVEDADVESFAPLIDAGDPDSPFVKALDVGRIKNRVLWYTAAVQCLQIKIAKDQTFGLDTSWEEEELNNMLEQLDFSIAEDQANYGLPAQSVQWPPIDYIKAH